jgi:hypothetical protein
MRAGESEIVTQEIDQRLAGLDPLTDFLAVDAQLDLENAFGHMFKARCFYFRSFPRRRESSNSGSQPTGPLRGDDRNIKPIQPKHITI